MFLVVVISALVLVEVVELIKKFGGICPLLGLAFAPRVTYGKASPEYVRIYDNFSRRAGCNCGASLCHAEVF